MADARTLRRPSERVHSGPADPENDQRNRHLPRAMPLSTSSSISRRSSIEKMGAFWVHENGDDYLIESLQPRS